MEKLGRADVVGVEHRKSFDAEVVENLRFRLAVLAQRGVIVEMVVGDVGHARGVKLKAGHARLVERVARNLHHGVGAVVASHPRKERRQPLGRRRGVGRFFDDAAVEVSQRAKHADAIARRRQHAGDQATRGRFAVGARYADQFQLPAWIAGQRLTEPGKRLAGVGNNARGD